MLRVLGQGYQLAVGGFGRSVGRSVAAVFVVQAGQINLAAHFGLQRGLDQPFQTRFVNASASLLGRPVFVFERQPLRDLF